jgi:hypothetical protein
MAKKQSGPEMRCSGCGMQKGPNSGVVPCGPGRAQHTFVEKSKLTEVGWRFIGDGTTAVPPRGHA